MFLDCWFNSDSGYLEGLVRGFKNAILKQHDYSAIVECDTLEGSNRKDPFIIFLLIYYGF